MHMEPPTLDDLVERLNIPLGLLDQACSDDHFASISLYLDWRRVAPHLGLDKTDIAEIESKMTDSEKRLETLQKWQMKFAYKTTYRVLVQVLLKVGCAGHAERVCRLLQPQAHTGMKRQCHCDAVYLQRLPLLPAQATFVHTHVAAIQFVKYSSIKSRFQSRDQLYCTDQERGGVMKVQSIHSVFTI